MGRAQALYQDAPIIAVKGASASIKAFALFGLHPGKLGAMRQAQLRIHSDFAVHTSGNIKDLTRFKEEKETDYDYYWEGCTGGCSGWGAVKLAHKMGFDKVIMCGIPLDPIGQINGKFSKAFSKPKSLEFYRSHVRNDKEYHPTTISMSGWTRDILGDYFISD